jgi:glutaredoxin-like protein NrdH
MIELDSLEAVEGEKKNHDVVLFALSTCPHCRNARNFLDSNDVAYRYVYVDLLEGEEQKAVADEATKYNPRRSFPTLVIDGDEVLVGFAEQDWRLKLL